MKEYLDCAYQRGIDRGTEGLQAWRFAYTSVKEMTEATFDYYRDSVGELWEACTGHRLPTVTEEQAKEALRWWYKGYHGVLTGTIPVAVDFTNLPSPFATEAV